MLKTYGLLLLAALVSLPFAQNGEGGGKRSQKKFEEEQRLDEYANSLRRRDWLKDRLILEVGFGSKYHAMGQDGQTFGVGAEYITRWHFAPWVSYGFLPKSTDREFDEFELKGFTGAKGGLAYYLFPKAAMHIGFSAAYGDVTFDHVQQADEAQLRDIVVVKGWQGDLTISYLTDQWYYLTFNVGGYYAGKKLPGTKNGSMIEDDGKLKSLVVDPKGIPDAGIVLGAGIGFALPDLFPDDTEKRRRVREGKKKD